jgi:hypothetical protein
MRGFRLIPALETYPSLVAWVRTPLGRAAAVAVFAGLLALAGFGLWLPTGVFLLAVAFFPERRRALMSAAALYWVYRDPPLNLFLLVRLPAIGDAAERIPLWSIFVVVAAVFALFFLYARAVRRFPDFLLCRRPTAVLLSVLGLIVLIPSSFGLAGFPYFVCVAAGMILARYLWFFSYALSDLRAAGTAIGPETLGALRPFWGYTDVPFGKGALFLSRIEAKDADELAVVRLKGLKLLAWSLILQLAAAQLNRLDGVVPSYASALAAQAAGAPVSWGMRWAVLLLQFLRSVAQVSVLGHRIVAVARMTGFRAPRNTCRPFSSTSIAEYYNRFYYYFKELLADFFFYPTYLRFFKESPRLRLFASTLAAAGLGNFVFHVVSGADAFYVMGPGPALKSFAVYAVYCLILGTAIAVSQLRARGRAPRTGARRAFAIAGVFVFYLLITVVAESEQLDRRLALSDYGLYFANLFRP